MHLAGVVGAHGAHSHLWPVVQLPVRQVAPDQAPAECLTKLPAACVPAHASMRTRHALCIFVVESLIIRQN